MQVISMSEARERLRSAVDGFDGTQSDFAIKHGLPMTALSETLSGKRDPSKSMLALIGLARVAACVEVAR